VEFQGPPEQLCVRGKCNDHTKKKRSKRQERFLQGKKAKRKWGEQSVKQTVLSLSQKPGGFLGRGGAQGFKSQRQVRQLETAKKVAVSAIPVSELLTCRNMPGFLLFGRKDVFVLRHDQGHCGIDRKKEREGGKNRASL